MDKYEVDVYVTEAGNSPFKKYMKKLGKENRVQELAQIKEFVGRLKEYGMTANQVYPETFRQLEGDIYELRPQGHRVAFFYFNGSRFVILHAFKKQHGKAPKSEIKQAKREMNDYKGRNHNG